MANINGRVRNLTGNTTAWSRGNPVIARGELAVEIEDEGYIRFKIGNGDDRYRQLDYAIASSTVLDYLHIERYAKGNQVPNNSFFVDDKDFLLKFKDNAGVVREVAFK